MASLKAVFAPVADRWDSWKNTLTGLGGSKDKRLYARFVRGSILDDETLESLYHENDLAATICDTFPEEALRQGFTLRIQDGDALETKIVNRMVEMGAVKAVLDGAVWGNVFGGGAVLIGANDHRTMDKPLALESVTSVDFLTVLDKRDLTPKRYYSNPLSPKYGLPETFAFTSTSVPGGQPIAVGQEIHETRFLLFYGSRTSARRRISNKGWPESRLQKIYEVLRDFDVAFQGASLLLQEASQAVYGVNDLLGKLAADGGQEALAKRFEIIEMSRSIAKAIVIDAETESFERKSVTFSGVSDIMDRFCSRLAAASEIPVTILMGQSPAGLNATGASDIRAFYDRVGSYQKQEIKPALELLVKLFLAEAKQTPKAWSVEFPSLYQMSEAEKAEIRYKVAQTDTVYIDKGVYTPEEVAISRFPAEGWSMDTTIDLTLRKQFLQEEKTAVDPDTAFTGVQTTSMLAIVQAVAEEKIPRESGVAMLIASYPITPEKAEEIMSNAGAGFEPKEDPKLDLERQALANGGPKASGGAPAKGPQPTTKK